ncbi:calcium-dependent phosphotriesterase, partial [Aureobasidium melanogenum]
MPSFEKQKLATQAPVTIFPIKVPWAFHTCTPSPHPEYTFPSSSHLIPSGTPLSQYAKVLRLASWVPLERTSKEEAQSIALHKPICNTPDLVCVWIEAVDLRWVCKPDFVVGVVDDYVVYAVERSALEIVDEGGRVGLVALTAIQDFVFVVASTVCLHHTCKVIVCDFERGGVYRVQRDRIASLEVCGKVDTVGGLDVHACLVCKLVLSTLDLSDAGTGSEKLGEGVMVDTKAFPLRELFSVVDVRSHAFEIHPDGLGLEFQRSHTWLLCTLQMAYGVNTKVHLMRDRTSFVACSLRGSNHIGICRRSRSILLNALLTVSAFHITSKNAADVSRRMNGTSACKSSLRIVSALYGDKAGPPATATKMVRGRARCYK